MKRSKASLRNRLVATLVLALVLVMSMSYVVLAKTFPDVPTSRWSYEPINRLSDDGIINGNTDGTFQPTGLVTFAHLATMLASAEGVAEAEVIQGVHWAMPNVKALEQLGKLPEGRYTESHMNISMNREALAEMVGYVVGAEGLDAPPSPFADIIGVPEPIQSAIHYLYDKGYLAGKSETEFDPQGLVTREQAAMVVAKVVYGPDAFAALTSQEQQEQQPQQTNTSEYVTTDELTREALDIVGYLYKRDYSGKDALEWFRGGRLYSFDDTYTDAWQDREHIITRGEAAILLWRMHLYIYNSSRVTVSIDGRTLPGYEDIDNLTTREQVDIKFAVYAGIMSPMNENYFGAKEKFTRSEFEQIKEKYRTVRVSDYTLKFE